MATSDEILKELREQTAYMKRNYVLLNEIKFELQNARVRADTTYKIKVKELWIDRIKKVFNF